MRRWHFYNLSTGVISGGYYSATDASSLRLNTPDGTAPIEGVFNPLCQRVDIETGEVVGFEPVPRDGDHDWDTANSRWLLKPEIERVRNADREARLRIEQLERKQHRRVRELLEQGDPRLKAIGDEIALLRSQIIETDTTERRA